MKYAEKNLELVSSNPVVRLRVAIKKKYEAKMQDIINKSKKEYLV